MTSKHGRHAFNPVRDIGLFLASARADARLDALRRELPDAATFDRLYAEAPHNDPWVSASPRYQYQRRKYEILIDLLPQRPYRKALDLGCGLGLLTERLSARVDSIVGLDISAVAVRRAADRTRQLGNVQFRTGDITSLDAELERRFDLVVVADAIYYLPPPLEAEKLERIVRQIAGLLAPGGILMVANHYFPIPNAGTRLTRQIHRAFSRSPSLALIAEHRRAFFLASVLRHRARINPR
jgi:SAM-dependent methyltransferase